MQQDRNGKRQTVLAFTHTADVTRASEASGLELMYNSNSKNIMVLCKTKVSSTKTTPSMFHLINSVDFCKYVFLLNLIITLYISSKFSKFFYREERSMILEKAIKNRKRRKI